MKTDKFIQGILVNNDQKQFRYHSNKPDHGLDQVVKRLRKLKKNLTSLKYMTQHSGKNKQAIFSKTTVEGNVNEAIADVWDRLRINHDKD